ncbi:hypothetical protein AU476_16455 [Cupriavidus sp. UYMSc13B]|nr:hypothetical protein AU476_16455 [Cupriavidus sp. UYMSc13B]
MAGAVQCVYFEAPELLDYFEPGNEILIFDSPAELGEQIESLRQDPDRRRRIAEAAQKRVIQDHTYGARAQAMLNALK